MFLGVFVQDLMFTFQICATRWNKDDSVAARAMLFWRSIVKLTPHYES